MNLVSELQFFVQFALELQILTVSKSSFLLLFEPYQGDTKLALIFYKLKS